MSFLNYLPASYKHYKSGHYVVFFAKNPGTGKLKQKLIRVNRIESPAERKKFIRNMINEINEKLHSGWNPFIEQEAPRGYTKLTDALDIFIRNKRKEFTSKDSIRTYNSQIDILKNYIEKVLKKKDMPVVSFDAIQARNYMDYLYNVRNISGRTFNNYKTFTVTLWNWFIENLYCKANPFQAVKKKNEGKKSRIIIDEETRKRIKEYLIKTENYEFLAMIMLCFHGLMRPKEICNLKPRYFNFEKQIIVLTPEITKDKDDRIVTLSGELLDCLERLNIPSINENLYIFSTSFKPGKVLKNTRDIGKKWDKLRKIINMPLEYQFYSLKDSGIVQKLKDGINPLAVRDQAGHSSLEQTNQYAKYANPEGSEEIKKKSSKF